jgi:hypothetical protein
VTQRQKFGMVATLATLMVAGCSSTIAHPSPTATATPSSPSPPPQSTQPASSPSPTLPVPKGFQPEALTAISESDFWVLGAIGCTASGCASEILHTVDGGRSFQPIHLPPSTFLAGNLSSPGPPTVNDIRFADASDGWVFGDTLWTTHSGGAAWHQITFAQSLLGVEQLEPGANGYVYAVFEVCADPTTAAGCAYRVMRSRSSTDTWTVISPPGHPVGRPVIGIHGNTLWVMYFQRSTGLEWISRDDGVFWVRGSMPCEPDLGGNFDPVTSSVIWAFCATGNAGGPDVSSTGGASWSSGGGIGGLFGNGATVAALSTRYAFVGGGGSGLSVTNNGGQTYRSIPELSDAQWVGFTDSEVGYVITRNQTTEAARLWRTTNAGANWSQVSLP